MSDTLIGVFIGFPLGAFSLYVVQVLASRPSLPPVKPVWMNAQGRCMGLYPNGYTGPKPERCFFLKERWSGKPSWRDKYPPPYGPPRPSTVHPEPPAGPPTTATPQSPPGPKMLRVKDVVKLENVQGLDSPAYFVSFEEDLP